MLPPRLHRLCQTPPAPESLIPRRLGRMWIRRIIAWRLARRARAPRLMGLVEEKRSGLSNMGGSRAP